MLKAPSALYLLSSLVLASPHDPAHQLIKSEFSLDQMSLSIDTSDVEAQTLSFGGKVSFEIALKAAMESFLHDDSDAESPLGLLNFDRSPMDINTQLHELLNQPSSLFALVSASDFLDATSVYPPEGGEKLEDFWIFFLVIPTYSDHLFWALVSRTDSTDVYNYGFN